MMKQLFTILCSLTFIGFCYGQKVIKEFDNQNYTTRITSVDTALVICTYYDSKKVFEFITYDGSVDTVLTAEFNGDGIPDFVIEDRYCDGSEIIGYISEHNQVFKKVLIYTSAAGEECDDLSSIDQENFVYMKFEDVNSDGNQEVLMNHMQIDGELKAFSCSDTISLIK
jgi:hypothetical protein